MGIKSLKTLLNKRHLRPILILLFSLFSILFVQATDDPGDKLDVVVLDAGHGGHDPGAVGSRSKEKDIVLAITLQLGKYIEENISDVKVVYTRKKDVFVELHERADIANRNHADLFISIHANWFSNSRTYGAETFTMGTSNDARNLQVAMKENSVITLEDDYSTNYEGFDPNSAESYIIFNLMQKTFTHQSIEFADLVQDQFMERARRNDRGVKQERFLVLWKTTMPSVLIETGFITNSAEQKYLTSKEGQEYLASAIYRAFREYKRNIENKSAAGNSTVSPKEERPEIILSDATDPGLADDENVYYMIQVLTTIRSRSLDDIAFSDYGHVAEFKANNLYKYAVGKSTSFKQISLLVPEVQESFPGAFVIAVRDGKIIPLSEAGKQNK
ncbi:MAG: N-acetylmuramoyl-L-alanine amidase [Bacteroidales bacterium]|nr:N-acetylmuramoyl-L-alanine amidase [Bacteroidales bacterium]